MPLSEADLAEATSAPATLPDDPAALAAARGDAVEGAPEAPAAEPAKPALSEADKAEVEAVVAPKAEETPAEDPPRDPETGKFIPKARFDQLREKSQAKIAAAEARAQAAEAKAAKLAGPETVQAAEAELKAKTRAYNGLLADGKLDEAAEVFDEISRINRQIAKLEMAPAVAAASTDAMNAQTLDEVIELYTEAFPEFREGSKEFNQELVNEAVELQTAFEATGKYSPAAALRKAADMVIAAHQLAPLAERKAEPKPEKKADKAAERKADAVKTNVDAAGRQPPSLASLGTDSDKMGAANIDIPSLTQDDFAKLPEATLRRLRGDLV